MPWTQIAQEIWEVVRGETAYLWPIRERSIAALRNVMPDAIPPLDDDLLARGGGVALRAAMAAALRNADTQVRQELHSWIVCDWGRITKPPPGAWADQLQPYDWVAVRAFIAQVGATRVASWSKILAFADHTQYAIYDSWTATALNIALCRLEDARRFRVPPARAHLVNDVRRRLGQRRMPGRREAYLSYIDLLRSIVEARLAPNILSVEQTIFANARVLAAAFLAERVQVYPAAG